MSARRKGRAQEAARTGDTSAERPLAWPGDPEGLAAADIDFEGLAHVLANNCRRGGRMRRYHSLAAHAVIVSEEVETLDGLDAEVRRRLALHALLAPAPSAWLGDRPADSHRAAERTSRLAAGIARAVREAAGLDAELGEDKAELLRFVSRMAASAERRDLAGAGPVDDAGAAFPPLRRRIRPVGPERAARLWLARLHALASPPGHAGAVAENHTDTTEEEDGHVTHIPETQGADAAAPHGEEAHVRRAA